MSSQPVREWQSDRCCGGWRLLLTRLPYAAAAAAIASCRVLIYSQFTRTLDILEDWVAGRRWGYQRIDGG